MPNRKEVEPHVLEIISGRNPYQLYLMALLTFSGLSVLLTAPAPASLERSFPAWVLAAWGVSLFLGAGVNLVAVLVTWRDRLTSMVFELVSCVVLVGAGALYSFATFKFHMPNTSYIGVGFISVLAVASVWRGTQLAVWIYKIREIRAFYRPVTNFEE